MAPGYVREQYRSEMNATISENSRHSPRQWSKPPQATQATSSHFTPPQATTLSPRQSCPMAAFSLPIDNPWRPSYCFSPYGGVAIRQRILSIAAPNDTLRSYNWQTKIGSGTQPQNPFAGPEFYLIVQNRRRNTTTILS